MVVVGGRRSGCVTGHRERVGGPARERGAGVGDGGGEVRPWWLTSSPHLLRRPPPPRIPRAGPGPMRPRPCPTVDWRLRSSTAAEQRTALLINIALLINKIDSL